MKKMFKRLSSMILCVCLLVGLPMSVQVAAAEPFEVVKVEELPEGQSSAFLPAGRTLLVYFNNTPSDAALSATGFGKGVNIRVRATGAGLESKDLNAEIVASYGTNPIAVTFGNDTANNLPAFRAAGYDTFRLAIRENNTGTNDDKGYIKGFADTNGTLLTAPDGTVNRYDEVLKPIERRVFAVTQVVELPDAMATAELPSGRTLLVYFNNAPTAEALAATGFGKAVNIRVRAYGDGVNTKDMNGEIVASYGTNPIAVTFGNDKTDNLPALRETGYDSFVLAIRENNTGTNADKGYVKGFADANGTLLTAPDGTSVKYDEVVKTVEKYPFTVTKVEEMHASLATAEMPAGRTLFVYFSETPSDEALAAAGFGKAVNIRIRATGEGLEDKDMNGEIVASYGKNPIAVTFGNDKANNLPAMKEAGYDTFTLAIRENGSGTNADKGYVKGFADANGTLLTAPDGTSVKYDEVVTPIGAAVAPKEFKVTKVEELPNDQATAELPAGRTVLIYFNHAPSAESLAITGYKKAVNIRVIAKGNGVDTKDMNGEIVASYGTNPIAVTFGNDAQNNIPTFRALGYDSFQVAIRENGTGTNADQGFVKDFADDEGTLLAAPDGTVNKYDAVMTDVALVNDTERFRITKVEELPDSQATAELPAGRTVLVYFSQTPSDEALVATGFGKEINIRVRAYGAGLADKDMNGEIVASYGKNPIAVTFGNIGENNIPNLRGMGYHSFIVAIRENGVGTSADSGSIKGFADENGSLLMAMDGTVARYDEAAAPMKAQPFAVIKAEKMPKAQATAELPADRTVLVYFNNIISDEALANIGTDKAVNLYIRAEGHGLPFKEMRCDVVASQGKYPLALIFGDDAENRFDKLTAAGYDTFTVLVRENHSGTPEDKEAIHGFTSVDGDMLIGVTGNDDVTCEEVRVPVVIHLTLDSVEAISDIETIITFSAPVEIVDDPFFVARLYNSDNKLVWKTPDGKYVDKSVIDGVKNTPMQWTLKYEWYNKEHTQLRCNITGGKDGMANFTDFNSMDWESLVPGSYLGYGVEEKNKTAVGGNGYVDNIRSATNPNQKLYAFKPGSGTNYDGTYVGLTVNFTPQSITASAKILNDMQLCITFSQPVTIKADPYMAIRFIENGKLLWIGNEQNQLPAQFAGTWEWVEGSKTAIIWTMNGANSLGANNIFDVINRRGAVSAVGEREITICIEEADGKNFTKYGSNGRVDNIASLDGKNHLKAKVAAADGCYIPLNGNILKKDNPVDLLSAVAVDDQTMELTFSEPVLIDGAAEGLSMMLRYVNDKGNSEVLTNGKTANFKGTWKYKDDAKNVLVWTLNSYNAESLTDIFNYNDRLEWNKGAEIVFVISNTKDCVPYSSRIRGITDLSGYHALNARGTEMPEVMTSVEIKYDLPAANSDGEQTDAAQYVTNYMPYLIITGACVLVCAGISMGIIMRKKEEK